MSESLHANAFMGSSSSFEDAKVVMFGCPFDGTTSFRPGARFGPQAMREASYGVETWSPYMKRDLEEISFHDAGDLELPLGDTKRVLETIAEEADRIVSAGKIPFATGGEHLISLPVIRRVFEEHSDLRLIHLDAHADLRPDYLGNPFSHATIIRRVMDFLPANRLFQFGIRSGTREEFEWMEKNGTLRMTDPKSIDAVIAEIGEAPVYVTVDLDILDTSLFPGTGTPEPGGLTFHEFITFTKRFRNLKNIVGMDAVELAPHYDSTGTSNVVAAKACREMLLAL